MTKAGVRYTEIQTELQSLDIDSPEAIKLIEELELMAENMTVLHRETVTHNSSFGLVNQKPKEEDLPF